MICLKLFLTFFEIGLFTFGGGYAMISLIREKALSFGWLTEEELLNMIAVSESTPGPIAVNMATFIGSTQGGMLGAFLATLGVVLPSFVLILALSYVIFAVTNILIALMRSIEAVKIGFVTSLIALFVNISLNYCLISGNFGFPFIFYPSTTLFSLFNLPKNSLARTPKTVFGAISQTLINLCVLSTLSLIA